MNVHRLLLLSLVLGCAAGWAWAQDAALSPTHGNASEPIDVIPDASTLAATYQRLDLQRKSALAAFDAAEDECAHTFAATDCLAKVQNQRRSEEAQWHRQEMVLHDLERRKRSEDELTRLNALAHEKERALAAVAQSEKDAQQRQADVADKQARHARQQAVGADAPARSPSASPTPSAAEQAQNRATYQRKLEAAEERRRAVEKRLKEQAAKPVQPLPLPAPP